MEKEFKAIYGQAMSIVTHKPSQYAKNITLRYPMKSTFKGNKIRICLDNFTGKEGVVFDSITIGRVISGRDLDPTSIVDITFNGSKGLHLDVGEQFKRIHPLTLWRIYTRTIKYGLLWRR